jgi:hypothetical protein
MGDTAIEDMGAGFFPASKRSQKRDSPASDKRKKKEPRSEAASAKLSRQRS